MFAHPLTKYDGPRPAVDRRKEAQDIVTEKLDRKDNICQMML